MSPERQAILFSALPLLLLGVAYLSAAATLVPHLWRERAQMREIEYALATVYPAGAVAALIFGIIVLREREAPGGSPWWTIAAVAFAAVPVVGYFVRWRERGLLLSAPRRVREAEARRSARERELDAVRALGASLARAPDPEAVARQLLDTVARAVGVEWTALALVDDARREAVGLLARENGVDVDWYAGVTVDLEDEPSGVASAASEVAPLAIYDAAAAPQLNAELIARAKAKSVAFVPLVGEARVVGVLVAATTGTRRRFTTDELRLMQALAAEAALALDRTQSAAALEVALAENQRRIAQQAALLKAAEAVGAELELATVLQRLVRELAALVTGDAAACYLYDASRDILRCAAATGVAETVIGSEVDASAGPVSRVLDDGRAVVVERDVADALANDAYRDLTAAIVAPVVWSGAARGLLAVGSRGDRAFADADLDVAGTFAGLAALALRNAETYEERTRQARVQRGFYRVASILGASLSLTETVDAVAAAAAETLGGSFAVVLMPENDRLVPLTQQELPPPLAAHLAGGAARGEAPLHDTMADDRIIASPDLAGDDRFGEQWRRGLADAGFKSLIAVPVHAPRGDDRRGVVLVLFADPRTFADDDVELARHLAEAARGALERSALYEAERSARSLAQQLSRTGALLATELDPAGVLDEVVAQAPALVGADACTIRVLEDEELVVSAAGGPGAEATIGARSPSTAWLSGDVFQSRAPVAIADVAADERLVQADPLLGLGYSAYLGVPLVGPEAGLHGVLAVYARSARQWRADEIEALQALAANASAALSNAELYQRVASEKQRSDAILSNIADGIVAVDRDGRVVLWNAAAEQITGVPQEEALGRTPEQVLRRTLASDGDAVTGDRLVPIQRGGKEVWLSLTEAVMRDPLGAVSGRIYAFRDISADRFVEQMKSEFVSTVSQELRRPLTSIYGFAETLLRSDVLFGEEERRTFLGYIASESERLTAIVDALLNVARLDAGDLQVNLAPTDVGSLVSEVVDTVEHAAVDGHRFVVDVPTEPLAAEADADKLRLVLGNLLDNAVKYSPNGGTVTVAARRRSDTVEVAVADEGIGIPPAEQQRIFRKFYRAETASAREGGGTGIGLFIAEGLVTAMGGRIWVKSSEGEGSTFTFELPAAHRRAREFERQRV